MDHNDSLNPGKPIPDLRPIPPEKPLPMDCCESGCARCVWDIFEDERAYYDAALAAWEARQREGGA